jgi:ACS family hexuronate transporter-like MFS transporter
MTESRLRWTILALLCFSTVINYVDRQALAVVLPALRGDLGITSVQYGTITTLFLIAYTAAQVASGVVIDRVGTRTGFIFCVTVWSLAAVGHAFATGPASLASLRFLLGLSEAGNWPAGAKAIAEWFPKSRRAFAMGVFDGGSAVGAILAPPVVALLALRWGWRAAFVVTGALGLVWVVAFVATYRSPAQSVPAAAKAGYLHNLGAIVRVRGLWGLMVARMVATPVWWFYVFWLPDYLNKGRGFSLKEIGFFGWIPFLTVDIGKLLGGAASDALLRNGRSATFARKSVMAVGALAMLGGARVVGADSAAAAIAWVSLATFGFGMWSANILALHADIFPPGAMATAIGLTGAAASLGGACFTYMTGWLVEWRGYGPVFWIAGTAALWAFLSLVFVLGRVEPARNLEVHELASRG